MFRAIMVASVLSAFAACGGAPAPTRSNLQAFSVISEQADPAAGTLTLLIRVSGPATQGDVKPIVESVIASKKGDYAHIIVKSYVEGTTASDPPFAISRLEDGAITHRFNSMNETQKIPTH
jgi:hypothetical protein